MWYFLDGRHEDTLGRTVELKIVLIIKDLNNKEQSSATWNWKWRQMPESGASFESAEWCCALCCMYFRAPRMYLCIKQMYFHTGKGVFLRHFNVLPSDVHMYFYVVEMKCTARCFGFLAFDCGICLQSDRPSIYTCTSTNTNTPVLPQIQIQILYY